MKHIKYLIVILFLYACDKENQSIIEAANKPIQSSSLLGNSVTNCPDNINVYTQSDADHVVSNVIELKNEVANAVDGEIIYLSDNTIFDLSGECNSTDTDCHNDRPNSPTCYSLIIKKSIKLVSGRNGSSNGAIISSTLARSGMIKIEADNVIISGIRIRGNDTVIGQVPNIPGTTDGIFICGYDNLTVENCEISGWSHAGVYLKNSANNLVVNNYIHHNRRYGLGYGVSIHTSNDAYDTNARISCNYFEYNRHDIAGNGHENESYVASYNTIGLGGNGHSFDMHGKGVDTEEVAGRAISIHHNNFTNKHQTGILIRGIPVDKAVIYQNVFAHDNECEAIHQTILGQDIPIDNLKENFLVLNNSDNIEKYTFGKYKKIATYDNTYASNTCAPQTETISQGWSNYTRFLPGKWTNNGTDDLMGYHVGQDNMNLYKFKSDGSGFDYGYTTVSHGWTNYSHLLVGNWTNNGTDDLMGYHVGQNNMNLYTFKSDGSGFDYGYTTVSSGWTNYSHLLVGNWTNNGTDDLMGYHVGQDNMNLYKFKPDGSGFYSGYTTVSHGWSNYSNFLVGNWTNNGTDDLIAYHNIQNQLNLYKFKPDGSGFYSGYTGVASDLSNFKEFFTYDWKDDGIDDIVGITHSNDVYLFKNNGQGNFEGSYFLGVFSDLKLVLKGNW